MNKQICFAGFTGPDLDLIEATRGQVSSSWGLVLARNGAEALATLEAAPIAALVTSLTLPDMGGAELLQSAAVHHPETLRFALGDMAKRELVADLVGAPYQFVSTPWNLPELLSIVERGLGLEAWLSNDRLREFVGTLGRLPGLPASYFEVLKRAESPNSTVQSVGEVISRDPALSARLLQTVNSAACGLSEKVTSPVEAVSVLGLETVKSLVLCLQVFNESSSVQGASISLPELWRHSFTVAQLARDIAAVHDGNRLSNDAFTAGLLHRTGQIILATNLSKQYATALSHVRGQSRSLQQVEMAEFGVTSDQVGAYLLGIWGMPLPLVEAVAFCHQPSLAQGREFSLLTAVHVADVLACEEQNISSRLPVPKLDRDYLAAVGLPLKPEAWRKSIAGHRTGSGVGKTLRRETIGTSGGPPVVTSRFPSLRFLAGTASLIVALILVAGAVTKWSSQSVKAVTKPPLTLEQTNGEAVASAAKAPAAPKPKSVFDAVKVQGIFSHGGQSFALINGRTVTSGESINGITVISIQSTSVVLAGEGKETTVYMR